MFPQAQLRPRVAGLSVAIPRTPLAAITLDAAGHVVSLPLAGRVHARSDDSSVSPSRKRVQLERSQAGLTVNGSMLVASYVEGINGMLEEQLMCSICRELCVFPVVLGCGEHLCCFKCIHTSVDKSKDLLRGRRGASASFKLTAVCPECRHSSVVSADLKELKAPSRQLLTLVSGVTGGRTCLDRGACPYPGCEKTDTGYDHVRACGAAHYSCYRDGCSHAYTSITRAAIDAHDSVCTCFRCRECGATGLTRAQLQAHARTEREVTESRKRATDRLTRLFQSRHLHSHPTVFEAVENFINHVAGALEGNEADRLAMVSQTILMAGDQSDASTGYMVGAMVGEWRTRRNAVISTTTSAAAVIDVEDDEDDEGDEDEEVYSAEDDDFAEYDERLGQHEQLAAEEEFERLEELARDEFRAEELELDERARSGVSEA